MGILLAIKGCEEHYDRWNSQLATWAKPFPGVVIRHFVGSELGVLDDYISLPDKTKAICNYAKDGPFDFAFLADSDTYVSVPRLLASDFQKWDYSGYKLEGYTRHPYCSGPHYWLSRKAFEILAKVDWSRYPLQPEYDSCEDCKVGEILFRHGIHPHHDPRYAPYDAVLPNNDRISQHLSTRGCFRTSMMYEAHEDFCTGIFQDRRNVLTSDSVVFDMGGFNRKFLVELLATGVDPYVHVFESAGRFYEVCVDRFKGNPKVKVHRFSLSDHDLEDVHKVMEDFPEVDLININIEGWEYVLLYHLLHSRDISKLKNIQVQFYDSFPEADWRRSKIRQLLANTHSEQYTYPATWNFWRRK